jgi:hypothetical protein
MVVSVEVTALYNMMPADLYAGVNIPEGRAASIFRTKEEYS